MQKGQSCTTAFPTRNEALAKALHIAGVPWYRNAQGQAMGVLNDYTRETLREIDARRARENQRPLNLATLPHEEAVRAAFRHGVCGEVTYQFAACELLDRVLAGYDAQSKLILESDARAPGGDEPVGDPLDCSPETLGAICCQFTKAGKNFKGAKGLKPLWMLVPPFFVERDLRTSSHAVQGGTERRMEGSLSRKEVHV